MAIEIRARWQRKGFTEHSIIQPDFRAAKALIDGIPEPEDLAHAVVEGRYVGEWGPWTESSESPEAPTCKTANGSGQLTGMCTYNHHEKCFALDCPCQCHKEEIAPSYERDPLAEDAVNDPEGD